MVDGVRNRVPLLSINIPCSTRTWTIYAIPVGWWTGGPVGGGHQFCRILMIGNHSAGIGKLAFPRALRLFISSSSGGGGLYVYSKHVKEWCVKVYTRILCTYPQTRSDTGTAKSYLIVVNWIPSPSPLSLALFLWLGLTGALDMNQPAPQKHSSASAWATEIAC